MSQHNQKKIGKLSILNFGLYLGPMTQCKESYRRGMVIMVALMFTIAGHAQVKPGAADISIQLQGYTKSSALLAYYYNGNTYVRDTIRGSAPGQFRYKSSELLPYGVYMLVDIDEKSKIFDFCIHTDQQFALVSKMEDPYRNMKVTGDECNEYFFKNVLITSDLNQKSAPYSSILRDASATEEQKKEARQQLSSINDEMMAFHDDLLKNHGSTLIAKLILARKPVEVPEIDPSKGVDTLYQYRYFKKHYWDNIDLSEEGLLRLPFELLNDKFDEYFDKVVLQEPDTLIKEAERVIAMTKGNSEMYKYVTWTLTSKFYSPQVMGLDKVFVYLSDTYFKSGKMDFWADEQLKKNVFDRADQLRLSMLGMKAPNLVMQDAQLKPRSMYDIKNKYTILYFYDPDCGHCKTETPVLVDAVNKTRFDIQVYTVSADTSLTKMKSYIKEMGMDKFINVNGPRSYSGSYQDLYDAFQTPTLYILNEKKEIIAKKLPSENIEDFLEKYERIKGIK